MLEMKTIEKKMAATLTIHYCSINQALYRCYKTELKQKVTLSQVR